MAFWLFSSQAVGTTLHAVDRDADFDVKGGARALALCSLIPSGLLSGSEPFVGLRFRSGSLPDARTESRFSFGRAGIYALTPCSINASFRD